MTEPVKLFEDIDGSSIELSPGPLSRVNQDIIEAVIVPPNQTDSSLRAKYPSVPALHCVFMGTAGGLVSNVSIDLIIAWFCESCHGSQQMFVVGIDTETGSKKGVSLLQLCVFEGANKPSKVIVANAKSGAFPKIAKMLSGEMSHVRPICAGAEVYGDVLLMANIDMKVLATLDISSMNDPSHAIGLRQMLDDKIGTEWVKDKKVTCSDWDKLPLDLPQLKYAALDAWASEVLGRIILQELHPECFSQSSSTVRFRSLTPLDDLFRKGPKSHLMSSVDMPKSLSIALYDKLEQIQSFDDASRTEFEVPFENIGIDNKKRLQTRISLQSFQKRLRRRYKVEATIGSKKLNGKVTTVTGRLCFVEWRTLEEAQLVALNKHRVKLSSNNFNEMDKTMMSAKYGFYHFISHFYPPTRSGHRFDSTGLSVSEVFNQSHLYLPREVRELIDDSSSSIDIALAIVFNAKDALSVISRKEKLKRQKYSEYVWGGVELHLQKLRLNESQKDALRQAVGSRVSLVRGPPGTGKTSTIASFADLWTRNPNCCANFPMWSGPANRVLILAPANAATLRVLESVVAANLRSVALVVSSDWMVEWHQDSVLAHLHPFVVTPHVLDHVKQKHRQRTGEYATGAGGAEGDLNDRALTQPPCKWDRVINVDVDKSKDAEMDLPDIVIMTYSFFMSLKSSKVEVESGKKTNMKSKLDRQKSAFKTGVSLLLSKETISAVVVDECSQLWEGHAVALFSKFNTSTRFMLVGDDKQLPPFGSDDVNKSSKKKNTQVTRSLFEATHAASPIVPCTQLNVSYRLPNPVGEVVSAALYQNQLSVVRNPMRDFVVRRRFQRGSNLSQSDSTCDVASNVLRYTKLQPPTSTSKSLVWINVQGECSKVGGKSSANEREARVAASLACGLLKIIRLAESEEGIKGGYSTDTTVTWGGGNDEEGGDDDEEEDDDAINSSSVNPRLAARDLDSMGSGEEDDDEDYVVEYGLRTAMSSLSLHAAEDAAVKKSSEHLNSTRERMRMNVITPYEGQRATIEKMLCEQVARQSNNGSGGGGGMEGSDLARWVRSSRTVGNVDALQGQEADVCIISPVRAPGLNGGGIGFLADNRRLNVMLTRVQQLIVIVGDIDKWARAPKDSLLRSFALKALAEKSCFNLDGSNVPRLTSLYPPLLLEESNEWKNSLPDAVVSLQNGEQRTSSASVRKGRSRSQRRTDQRNRSRSREASVGTIFSVSETVSPPPPHLYGAANVRKGRSRSQRRTDQRNRSRASANFLSSFVELSMEAKIRAKYAQKVVRGRVRGNVIYSLSHQQAHWSSQKECRNYCEQCGYRVVWSRNQWYITNKS